MILIAIGANLPGPSRRSAEETVAWSLDRGLAAAGLDVRRRSSLYRSEPQPPSAQPFFVNAVAEVATGLDPRELLSLLHEVETSQGRARGIRNAARSLDLDLIDFHRRVRGGPGAPVLPHPRAHLRNFVLLPVRDVAPDWRHPVSGRHIDALIQALPAQPAIEVVR